MNYMRKEGNVVYARVKLEMGSIEMIKDPKIRKYSRVTILLAD